MLFDIDGNGKVEHVAWTHADAPAAFLVIDKNNSERIDDGLEIVGIGVADGGRNGIDSFIRLRARDNPKLSGSVSYKDVRFDKLLLWRDANHNAISEAAELQPAKDIVTRIGLGYGEFSRSDDHGNLFKWQGRMELRTAPGPNETKWRR